MRRIRIILLGIIALIPLTTLVHQDDLGRWDVQRSAMAGPDEFSYLLMARHFLEGGGLSLKESLGRDTFYPPGFPLLLAAWAKVFFQGQLTAFCAHAMNAALLCVDTLIAWFFARRILGALLVHGDPASPEDERFRISPEARDWLALLVAALFATNWHILECSLLIMSEPSFMLAVFGWLALALRWRRWHESLWRTLAIVLLAVVAWSIRGAGIVCVAATLLYPVGRLGWELLQRVSGGGGNGGGGEGGGRGGVFWRVRRAAPIGLILVVAIGYQAAITRLSPEKSVAAGEESANSYPRQLLNGLSNGGRLSVSRPADRPRLALNLATLLMAHFDDYASSFVPWPRENPDLHVRDIVGKITGLLGLLGWLWQMVWARRRGGGDGDPLRFLELFVGLYFALYLVWPFDFARFWSPILPIMLVYAGDALVRFLRPRAISRAAIPAGVVLGLLLAQSAQEDLLQLGAYGRRLNYVSDALAEAVRAVVKRSPDPAQTNVLAMNGDDHFALAWYFSDVTRGMQKTYIVHSPEPHLPAKGGAGERVEEMVLRMLAQRPKAGSYLFSYFEHGDAQGVLENLKRMAPERMARTRVQKVYQKEIISAAWELRPGPGATGRSGPPE